MKQLWIFILLILVLVAGMWLSSGNLTPYAATLEEPHLVDYKGNILDSASYLSKVEKGHKVYIVNYDHFAYMATHAMLDGQPREHWIFNVIQRRILYFIIAFPFMKWLGFLSGGFLCTLLITLLSIGYTYRHVQNSYGRNVALFFLILMCSYPGIAYWCGTSFAQVTVVPLSLVFYVGMLVYENDPSNRNAFILSIILGIGFLAYDLAVYFIPASILLFCCKRRWIHLFLLPIMVLPSILLNMLYSWIGFPLMNDNTSSYKNILLSYLKMDTTIFLENIKKIPRILYYNYMDSQFLFLGVLGILLFTVTLVVARKNIKASAISLSIVMLGIFLFANMAPPYDGWGMRGGWIARLYQPFFVVIVFTALSLLKSSRERSQHILLNMVRVSIGTVFLFNSIVVFGPISGYFGMVDKYENFYQHAPRGAMEKNIKKYGNRPLGL